MESALASLSAASIAFVGGHFVLSHPLRPGLVRALGERGFLGLYTLVALATFAWMVMAFLSAPFEPRLWGGFDDLPWAIASVLTLVALTLFLGSLKGNPALPSYWPRLTQLGALGWLWIAGLALWLAITWAHAPLGYVPAGVWKWVGGA